MTVAGEMIYIATSPKDIGHVWRNSETISLDPISKDMYTMSGLTAKQREIMFDSHPDARYNAGNPKPLTPTQMIIELHIQQLRTGPNLDALLENKIIPGMFRDLDISSNNHQAVTGRTGTSVVVSLKELVIDAFIKAETEAYFGPRILKIAPRIAHTFISWEDVNWKMLFNLPPFLSQDMLSVKQALVDAFTTYYRLPRSERPDGTFFVTSFEDLHREIGFDEEVIGKMFMLHYWA